ncbi:MAG: NTP transferase domain-containing protein [Spirochaeta sp.]|nr:NTP transferase domain-containing protein [Spirochaeta sp.]
MFTGITAIVLSGGKGKRLGNVEKAFLQFNGESLLERKIIILSSLCDELLVVTNKPQLYSHIKIRVVRDIEAGIGPLMGLYTGLLNSKSENCFTTASDMPFFSVELFNFMKELLTEKNAGYDVVMPRIGENYEPLFALYSRRCIPHIQRALEKKKRRIVSFLPEIKARYIGEEEIRNYDTRMISFSNINTYLDLEATRKLYKSLICI